MRHHLYHEILVFEHPEIQRILLKMLNNKLPMIAENGKTAKSLLMTSLCLEQFSHSHSHRAQRSYISFKVHLNPLIFDSIMKAAVITAEWSREESTIYPGDKEWVSIYVHRSKKGKLHNYIFNACRCNNLYLFFHPKAHPWSLMQGWLAPLEARVLRDGITYHLQGAESVRQCVTHDAPGQKPTVFLETKGIYPVQKLA